MRLSNIHDDYEEYKDLEDVDEFEDYFDPAEAVHRADEILWDAEQDISDAGYDVWRIGLDYRSGYGVGSHRLEVENPDGPNIIICVNSASDDGEYTLYAEGGGFGGDIDPGDDLGDVIADMIEEMGAEEEPPPWSEGSEYENLEDIDMVDKNIDGDLRFIAQEFVDKLNGKNPIQPERILEQGGYQTDNLGFLEIDEFLDVRGNPTFTIQTEDLIQYYKAWWFPGAQNQDCEYIGSTDGKWILEGKP